MDRLADALRLSGFVARGPTRERVTVSFPACSFLPGLPCDQFTQLLFGLTRVGMIRPKRSPLDFEAGAKEGLGLVTPLTGCQDSGQCAGSLQGRRVLRPDDLAAGLEGVSKRRLRLVEPPESVEGAGQVLLRRQDVGVARPVDRSQGGRTDAE